MVERRPNPPGWVPPKAPYNPYDPTDLRPAEGYPSEFNAPGEQKGWTAIPKAASTYDMARDQLRKMQYTPRPFSELYPGQYKVLRRKKGGSFNTGVKYSSMVLGTTIVIFGVFFYRWNDGYDNVFSGPYRWQLSMRDKLFGNLSERQKEDLEGKQRGMSRKQPATEEAYFLEPKREDDLTMQRPQRFHIIEAEKIRQEREEALLKAVDLAQQESNSKKPGQAAEGRKKWFGIF